MARKVPPVEDDECDRPTWYDHFNAFFGGFGWLIGLVLAFAVIGALTDPPKAGRQIGAFFGGIIGGFNEAMYGTPKSSEPSK
ncbi:MAG: hypothetical protein EOP83_34395 [Verrucomicrobiaceae bacterium]|nr:MAG: hypothetical protein EOP83_34395 [Verrucomicrobiaceae bacterium]